jgi:hypothetical protein
VFLFSHHRIAAVSFTMATIDYSKWDNIDTDSDSERSPVKLSASKVKIIISPRGIIHGRQC